MMSHSKQVIHSGIKLFSSRVLINLSSIAFTIFLAHTLSKTDFATFAVFGILRGIIAMTVNLGLETSCIQRVPELIAKGENNDASAIMKTTLLSRTILSAIFALLVFFLSAMVSRILLKTHEYDNIIRIMSLGILFSSLVDSLDLLAQITQQFGKISIIKVIGDVLSRVSSISLYFIMGLKGYIIGLAWMPIIGIILYILLLRKLLFVKSGFYPWFKLVMYSLPFYGKGFMRFGLMQLDQIVIGTLLEPKSLATYFMAKRFSNYIYMVVTAIGQPALIKISQLKAKGANRMRAVFSKISRYNCFVFIPLCIGVASISYPLFHLYGGKRYTNGTSILVLLALAMLVYSVMAGVYLRGVFLYGKPVQLFAVDGIGCLLNILFIVVFVSALGATGIALASLLAYIGSMFYARYLFKKIIPVQFDKKALKDSLIASFAMAAVIVVLQLIYYNLLIIPLYILVGLITFMLIFSRRLERKDIELVEDFLPGRFKSLVTVFYWFGAKRLEITI